MILKNKLLTRDQILSLLEIVSLAWPIAAIFMGIKIATNFAISPSAFTWNTVAASIGILLNFGLRSDYINRTSFEKTFPWLGIGTLIVVGVTLISPGLEGVHRYISIGKFISNPSAQLSPVALFLVYYFIPRNLYFAISLAMVLSGIHFFQPDAGQATSFGFSVVFLFAFARKLPRAGRTIGCFFPLALALATWLRPDPLPSLPHVEGILHLSLQLDWPWIALTFFLLIGLFIPFGTPFIKRARAAEDIVLPLSLLFYLALTFVVTELGNYPVPVFGAGFSPVLGYYLAIAASGWMRTTDPNDPSMQ